MKQGSRDLKIPVKMATCYTITEVLTPSCINPTINCYYILPASQEKLVHVTCPHSPIPLMVPATWHRHSGKRREHSWTKVTERPVPPLGTGHASNNIGAITFQRAPTEFQFASIKPKTGLLPGLSRTQKLDQYHLPTRSTGSFMTTHK